jgi:ferredoxin
MGICGTCKVRVVSGETVMEHNGGISEEEIADGYVLSCCTRVKGNVEVRY